MCHDLLTVPFQYRWRTSSLLEFPVKTVIWTKEQTIPCDLKGPLDDLPTSDRRSVSQWSTRLVAVPPVLCFVYERDPTTTINPGLGSLSTRVTVCHRLRTPSRQSRTAIFTKFHRNRIHLPIRTIVRRRSEDLQSITNVRVVIEHGKPNLNPE